MTRKSILAIAAILMAAGLIAFAGGQAIASHTPPGKIYADDNNCPGPGDGSQGDPFCTVQAAVAHASAGDKIIVGAGTYTTDAQVVISSDLTIIGQSAATTIIKPGYDTGSSGDSRGWFLVDSGVTFDLAEVTLDGTGNKVHQAIRHKGSGTISRVNFNEIKFDESGPSYAGLAVVPFGTGPVDISGSVFTEIGRVGVLYFGAGVSGSDFIGNTYTGKGDGDFLDYALDISAGAVINVSNNTISDNRGVASSDGSTSAAILVTTFYGAGTDATITCNTISDSTTGIAAGYDGSDTSVVTAHLNSLTGNGTGVDSTAPPVDAESNWWGAADGPGPVGSGSGDGVSTNVDFDPWLAAVAGPNSCSVGGIVEILGDGSISPASPTVGSGSSSLPYIIVLGVAAVALTLASGGMYAWRRPLRLR